MSDVEEALAETKRLLRLAVAPGASTQAKREFQENLTNLPSHRSYTCKSYFGTLISKFFAEFEDLQDRIVDAVLDLCEDEDSKTRIVGIKGLATTAKSDPRWVRGNAGVLLQLLESPPGELEHVKQSLQTLLSISPGEVFAVMADDCCGSEEETGASRRNILEYLSKDAAAVRKETLESGRHPQTEKIFREGFIRVLAAAKPDEARLVVDMLLPLASISGSSIATATPEASSAFIKALATSCPRRSSISVTKALLSPLNTFLSRKPPFDPRYLLSFVALHGEALIELAFEGDSTAKRILEHLRLAVPRSVDAWRSRRNDEDNNDPILEERVLVKAFAREIVVAVVDNCHDMRLDKLRSYGELLETLLWSAYQLMLLRDMRRDVAAGSDSRKMRDLAKDASKLLSRIQRRSSEEQRFTNIRNMAEDLSDERSRLGPVTPSWDMPSSSRAPRRHSPRPATPPPPPAPARSVPDRTQAQSTVVSDSQPREGTRSASGASAGKPAGAQATNAESHQRTDPAVENIVQDFIRRSSDPSALASDRKPDPLKQAERVDSDRRKSAPHSQKGKELMSLPTVPSESSRRGQELLGAPSSMQPQKPPATSSRDGPALAAPTQPEQATSLLSRLGGAPASSAPVRSESPGLLARLGPGAPSNVGIAQPPAEAKPARALKDRFNGAAASAPAPPAPGAATAPPTSNDGESASSVSPVPVPAGLAIRSRAPSHNAAQTLSILNRSAAANKAGKPLDGTSASLPSKDCASPKPGATAAAFSIKGTGALKRPLEPANGDEDEPIVYKKKGRGHQREADESGDIIMASPAVTAPAATRTPVRAMKRAAAPTLGSRLGMATGPQSAAAPKTGGSLAGRLSRPIRR